jgi:heme exporter protein C
MPAEMWIPLLVMVIALYLLFGLAMMLRLRNEILRRERRAGWVKELLGS